MAELVLYHILFLNFLLHDHFVDLLFSCRRLSGLLVTDLEAEWLGHSHSESALPQGLLTDLVHVVISCDALAAQITTVEVAVAA